MIEILEGATQDKIKYCFITHLFQFYIYTHTINLLLWVIVNHSLKKKVATKL